MDSRRLQDVYRRVATAAGCSVPLIVTDYAGMRAWTDGDNIYLTEGLVSGLTEREVSAVLGHELGHVVERHIASTISECQRLRQRLNACCQGDALACAMAAAVVEVGLIGASGNRSRTLEHRADIYGERLSRRAGYSEGGMSAALDTIGEAEESYTHPSTSDRRVVLGGSTRKVRIRIRRSRCLGS